MNTFEKSIYISDAIINMVHIDCNVDLSLNAKSVKRLSFWLQKICSSVVALSITFSSILGVIATFLTRIFALSLSMAYKKSTLLKKTPLKYIKRPNFFVNVNTLIVIFWDYP